MHFEANTRGCNLFFECLPSLMNIATRSAFSVLLHAQCLMETAFGTDGGFLLRQKISEVILVQRKVNLPELVSHSQSLH